MKNYSIVIMIGIFATWGQIASAQHTDVQFSFVDDQIQVDPEFVGGPLVFESNFPTFGIEQQFATLPGFASEEISGLGIGANDQIFYHVVDDLLFWDGTGLTTPPLNHLIRVENTGAGVPDTLIDEDSGEQLGGESPLRNRIGAADGTGDFHVDLRWSLEPNNFPLSPPPENFGVFGVKLQLTTDAPGIADSEPFIFAFNLGLNDTGFQQGVDAFAQLLEPAPGLAGDFDDDGDVDGQDFLLWQRGSPSNPPNADDLEAWRLNFGTSQPPPQIAITVPEPTAALLSLLGVALLLGSHPRLRRKTH